MLGVRLFMLAVFSIFAVFGVVRIRGFGTYCQQPENVAHESRDTTLYGSSI
jgi:hypothetical protein